MNTRKYSNIQEKRVAKKVKGIKNKNSGATLFAKGDVKTNSFLIECKTSVKDCKSITLKKEWIDKLKEEAFGCNKSYTSLALSFGDGKDYYLIDDILFRYLVDILEKDKNDE